MPDVFKLPKEKAIAALREAGVQADISEDSSLCGSLVEGRIIERGEVCYQHPPPGRVQGARLPVSIRVQTEDPRRGNVGTFNEWRLMPKVVGMTFDQALAEMKRGGFVKHEMVQHVWSDDTSCKPHVVCRQYPEPMDRVGLSDGKIFHVGQDRSARPTVAITEPTTPTTTKKAEQPSTPTPTPKPTTDTGERKPWGGDGSPAYRDSSNRPQGPGGRVSRGRGEPCTNKLDHCLRPGVWFAAENVVAGKLFRGTPVFELEGKWWTWLGEPAEYKFLFRTKVADNVTELAVGKPILCFVDEVPKWLTSEFDMLVTSRWSIGVVESLDGDQIRVKGWGAVSLESVRVIVEEKQAPASTPSARNPGDLF